MEAKKYISIFSYILFFLYIMLLSYLLFFSNYRQSVSGILDYNFIPFQTITRYVISFDDFSIRMLKDNFFGNIAAFMPFGFFLPTVTRFLNKRVNVLLASAIFSLIIESIQILFRVGSFDVDDIILNTSGGFLGFIIYLFIKKLTP